MNRDENRVVTTTATKLQNEWKSHWQAKTKAAAATAAATTTITAIPIHTQAIWIFMAECCDWNIRSNCIQHRVPFRFEINFWWMNWMHDGLSLLHSTIWAMGSNCLFFSFFCMQSSRIVSTTIWQWLIHNLHELDDRNEKYDVSQKLQLLKRFYQTDEMEWFE